MILVVTEQRNGSLNPVSWETVAAAQQMGGVVKVVVAGSEVKETALELAGAAVSEVLVVDHEALANYTPDGFVEALSQVVCMEAPELVLCAHTYQTRDYAPKLAARLDRVLIPDCIGSKMEDGVRLLVRPMFQGKFVADIHPEGAVPHFASMQVGACRADSVVRGAAPAEIRSIPIEIESEAIRQRPDAPFKEAKQAVDLTQADKIVAVGRGIKGEEQLPIAQELAKALGAELAASRPICDSGWLPMDRQIGSSGQTVAPKLYVALGISGAIQHLVGMKGAKTIVAINKDADAPIFEVSDYGIVGDLFEVVPALVAALNEK
ncbi:MAG: electron transfer flavoprotein subunit alpha/FixB family protein [Acidobacteriota bacterium]|nr:electron transfer flavoprotein subunit alpha/FixB family protein [Acidobacteriota bacterium]